MWSSSAKAWNWPVDLHWSRWGASLNQPMEVIGQVYVMCHHGQGVRRSCFPKKSGCFTLRTNECWPGTRKGCGITALLKCCLHSPLTWTRSCLFWFLLSFYAFISLHKQARDYLIMVPFQYTVHEIFCKASLGLLGRDGMPTCFVKHYSRPNFRPLTPSLLSVLWGWTCSFPFYKIIVSIAWVHTKS